MERTADELAEATAEPKVAELLSEFRLAWGGSRGASRVGDADDVRYSRWPGQTPDGRKRQKSLPEGTLAMPWDNSSDTRVHLVDDIINVNVDLLCSAFENARIGVDSANPSRSGLEHAAELRKVLRWCLDGPLAESITDEVELAAQIANHYGHVFLYVGWRQEPRVEMREISLAVLESISPAITGFISDPSNETAASAALGQIYPMLDGESAGRVVRELRESGWAEFELPVAPEQRPVILALEPYSSVVVRAGTADIQRARAIFRVERISVAEVRERAVAEQWDPVFATDVEASAGKVTELDASAIRSVDVFDGNATEKLVEVIYAYARQVNERGVASVYCTVLSNHVKDGYGKHELLDYAHGRYPFTVYRPEIADRRLSESRGVPDIAATWQTELKEQRDGIFNHSQLSLVPPLAGPKSRAGAPPRLGPAGYVGEDRPNQYRWFDVPPREPRVAFELISSIVAGADRYFGLPSETVHPTRQSARRQRMVRRWLASWRSAFWQLACLAYQFLSRSELAAVIGREPSLSASDVAGLRVSLRFNSLALDRDWVLELLKTIQDYVLPADSAGVMDRGKLVRLVLSYLDPVIADEATLDDQGAGAAVYREVLTQVALMSQGNEAAYTANDPAAGVKLGALTQIISRNPKYVSQVNEDERFAVLLKKYQDNLQHSVNQEMNKRAGVLGIKPQ